MRRILRIWPLYFFLLFISFFIYPNFSGYQASTETRLAYFFFYANFDVIKNGFDPGGIGHLWAISIEEQFYLVLPLVMLIIPIRYLHYLFLIIILAAQAFRILHYQEATVLYHHSLSAAFDIALGGLAAWLMYFNSTARNLVAELPRSVIIGCYFFFGGMVFLQDFIFPANQLILSLFLFQLFAAFILMEQNFANHSFFKVGNSPVISALGKYAYGFYCYHIFCIRLVETMCVKAGVSGVAGELILIPALGLLLTVATAMISYHLFEIHFLKWKNGFTYLR